METKKEMPSPAEVRDKETFSPEDLAVFLGVGRTTAYTLLKSGTIPSYKEGRLRRVRRQDAEAYQEAQLAASSR